MPLPWKPEDKPAAVCFHLAAQDEGLEVTVAEQPQLRERRYCIQAGSVRFENRDTFKRRAVEVGMTPAVAEDPGRSFNATARQLRELGFSVEVEKSAG